MEDEIERSKAEFALVQIKSVNEHLNESKKQKENRDAILQIQQCLVGKNQVTQN